ACQGLSCYHPSSGLLTEGLQCSICLDVFTDPVTTPCGHNFCKTCLNKCWDDSQTCSCPYCKETFKHRPDLKINTTLRELIDHYKKKNTQQMIQDRIKKIQDIKHSAEVRKRSTKREKAARIEPFTDLIRSIERHQTELLEMMEEQQKAAEKQEQELIEEREQEITELKMRNTELEQLSRTEDLIPIYSSLCSPRNSRNWPEISVNTHEILETLKRALTQLKDTIGDKLYQTKLKWMQHYAVDVTLDPDTAHPKLILSDDGKQVRHGDIRQKLPDKLERFDTYISVLGKEGFSSGRFYFEVDGYWTVWLRNGDEYKALSDPSVSLSLRVKPQRVGVFVDYEEGLVCFYDVESSSHIYSFTAQSFTGKLYPYFSPCKNDGGKNSGPLIITAVN
uniref:E3 ubiquitin-protein ligase TRIM39-like n=1 Tax=Sinocyclocheilus rhinocerous TaxID=307959 RepID=A0A673L4R0_9TELE